MLTGAAQTGLTDQIIRCAIAVHSDLGAGLLESVYRVCLLDELTQAGLRCEQERPVPILYKGRALGEVFRPDIIVDGVVLVEIKAVSALTPVHTAQVITYLKLTGCPVGLLINFNTPRVTSGVRRLVRPDLYTPRQEG